MRAPANRPAARSNAELRTFLSRFITGAAAPHYAVMLKGVWGAGKTCFINNFVAELDEKVRERTLYVSLYGVTKPADIEDAFFQQLYPRLANKKLQYGYSIFKSFLKGTLKIDLDQNHKDDGSIQISLPELEKFAVDPQNTLLIFDDLERAKMPPEELLGYINHFVEHEGRRVIIICNEDSLLKVNPEFRAVKEKVIGRMFEIVPEPESAVSHFVRETVDYGVESILAARKHIVLNVFERAGYKNLRDLRQSLLDFGSLWQCLPVEDMKLRQHEAFKDRLVEEFLSLSIEYRAGQLEAEDIEGLDANPQTDGEDSNSANAPGQAHAAARDRMTLHGLSASGAVLLPSAYAQFFGRGHLPEEQAREALARGAFFTNEAKPAWQQLWHRLELTNDRFNVLRTRLLQEFGEGVYRKPEDLLHAFGILVQLAVDGLLEKSTSEIAELGKTTLEKLISDNKLQVDLQAVNGHFRPDEFRSYGMLYEGRNTVEFQEFLKQLETEWSRSNTKAVQTRIAEWLDELRTDHKKWASRIVDSDDGENWFSEQPIFASIQPQTFLDTLLALEPPTLISIMPALRSRYAEVSDDRLWLADEAPFWKSLEDLLLDYMVATRTTTLTQHVIKRQVSPLLEEIADKVNAYSEQWYRRERQLFGNRNA